MVVVGMVEVVVAVVEVVVAAGAAVVSDPARMFTPPPPGSLVHPEKAKAARALMVT